MRLGIVAAFSVSSLTSFGALFLKWGTATWTDIHGMPKMGVFANPTITVYGWNSKLLVAGVSVPNWILCALAAVLAVAAICGVQKRWLGIGVAYGICHLILSLTVPSSRDFPSYGDGQLVTLLAYGLMGLATIGSAVKKSRPLVAVG